MFQGKAAKSTSVFKNRVAKIIIFILVLSNFFTGKAYVAHAAEILPLRSVVQIVAGNVQAGSGIVIDQGKKYILTNAHVVLDEATHKPFNKYTVCTIQQASDELSCDFFAELLEADVDADLALLQVNGDVDPDAPKVFQQPAIDINAAKTPDIGEKMSIIGFPALGGKTITVSQGIASGFEKDDHGEIISIKTDSNVISGNSGGLAVNGNGDFLGVPSSYLTNNESEKIGIVIAGLQVKKWLDAAEIEVHQNGFQSPKISTLAPGNITGVSLKKLSTTSVEVTWPAPLSNSALDYYALTYDTKDLFVVNHKYFDDYPNFTKTKNGDLSFVVSNLQAGKTYYFAVAPHNTDGYYAADWSAQMAIDLASGQVGNRLFSDVPTNHPNRYAIQDLKEEGVLSGYPDGTFRPNNSIKRAELMKIVVVAAEGSISPEKYNNCFQDVKDEWFAPPVCYAKEKGWIKGYSDNTFKPGQEVNLAEALKIIENIYQLPVTKMTVPDTFPARLQNQWYSTYLALANEFSIISGPLDNVNMAEIISRAKTAELLYRTMALNGFAKDYSPVIWKDSNGKMIDVASYFPLKDGMNKKFRSTSDGVVNDDEEQIKKGCSMSKDLECYTLTTSGDSQEVKYLNNAVVALAESGEKYPDPIVYDQPQLVFGKKNDLHYNRFKKDWVIKGAAGEVHLFDLVSSLDFMGNEKIKVPLGEYDTIKIHALMVARGEITFENSNPMSAFFSVDQTLYYAKGLGVVKSTTSVSMKIGGGEPSNGSKSDSELEEVSGN